MTSLINWVATPVKTEASIRFSDFPFHKFAMYKTTHVAVELVPDESKEFHYWRNASEAPSRASF